MRCVISGLKKLTAYATGESVEVVEAHRGPSEALQGAQRRQGVHGRAGTGACC